MNEAQQIDHWVNGGGGFIGQHWFYRTRFICPYCLGKAVIHLRAASRLDCSKGCFSYHVSSEFVHMLALLCKGDDCSWASVAIRIFKELPVSISSGGYDGYDYGAIPMSLRNLQELQDIVFKYEGDVRQNVLKTLTVDMVS